jgi:hypothetical protein
MSALFSPRAAQLALRQYAAADLNDLDGSPLPKPILKAVRKGAI